MLHKIFIHTQEKVLPILLQVVPITGAKRVLCHQHQCTLARHLAKTHLLHLLVDLKHHRMTLYGIQVLLAHQVQPHQQLDGIGTKVTHQVRKHLAPKRLVCLHLCRVQLQVQHQCKRTVHQVCKHHKLPKHHKQRLHRMLHLAHPTNHSHQVSQIPLNQLLRIHLCLRVHLQINFCPIRRNINTLQHLASKRLVKPHLQVYQRLQGFNKMHMCRVVFNQQHQVVELVWVGLNLVFASMYCRHSRNVRIKWKQWCARSIWMVLHKYTLQMVKHLPLHQMLNVLQSLDQSHQDLM
mmetsp:Transcript_4965/g.7512  ORF Transcript_4965/g.7512 Transcript_4965/m.7512 type:complete len:293 (+) Transcript_4965:2600-3478(+)